MERNGNLIRKFDGMGMKIDSAGNDNGNGNYYTGMGENGNHKPISAVLLFESHYGDHALDVISNVCTEGANPRDRGETEARRRDASRLPRDRGVETEATTLTITECHA